MPLLIRLGVGLCVGLLRGLVGALLPFGGLAQGLARGLTTGLDALRSLALLSAGGRLVVVSLSVEERTTFGVDTVIPLSSSLSSSLSLDVATGQY